MSVFENENRGGEGTGKLTQKKRNKKQEDDNHQLFGMV